jgi:dCMP deaminase
MEPARTLSPRVDEQTMTNDQPRRLTFEEVYMDFACLISRRSTCKRLQVGTVITTTDYRKVLAVGYNGNASGLPNSCDRDEPGHCGCLHSEENAAINCDAPRQTEKYVFVTHLPCTACAKRLINLGNVLRVVYKDNYRSQDALELLQTVGIEVQQFKAREPQ